MDAPKPPGFDNFDGVMRKPAKVPPLGDKGQRYAVYCRPAFWDDVGGDPGAMGWTDNRKSATHMADAAVQHPEATEAWVVDRQTGQRVYETRKSTR